MMHCWIVGKVYWWIGGFGKKCPSCGHLIVWTFDAPFGKHDGICGPTCQYTHLT